jgi:sugar O-acyltransferase (sialic acid O-acetyltransferase NeuD family)
MRAKLVIYGAGGFGREVKSMLPHVQDQYDLLGFLDDGLAVETVVDGVPVLGGLDWLENQAGEILMVLAMGDPKAKANIARQLQRNKNLKYPVLIHSKAHVQDDKRIALGEGTIIGAGSVLTTGITIGKHVLINLNATIGHDTVIGNFTSIMPGVHVSGNVNVGNEVMIGSGASIINKIKIGDLAIIGAGSVVNHDIPPASTAAGVPARVIR